MRFKQGCSGSIRSRLMQFVGPISLLLYLALAATVSQAEEERTEIGDVPEAPLAEELELLKQQVIELNRDLFILEEDLLFPASTQVVVYLSVDVGEFFKLDSVKLKVGDEVVAAHLYTDRQIEALKRGGMQRLYMGNLRNGEHTLTVFVDGIGPRERPYRKAASLNIEKDREIKALEVRIRDDRRDFEPEITLVEWDE